MSGGVKVAVETLKESVHLGNRIFRDRKSQNNLKWCYFSSIVEGKAELNDWVVGQGGKVEGVDVRSCDGGGFGHCLYATEHLSTGNEIISLPKSCQLTYEQRADGPLWKLIERVPKEFWGARLALPLLYHRVQGKQSQFWPYIQSLPESFPGIPIFFSPENIKSLEYPPVSSQIIKRCSWLMEFSLHDLKEVRDTCDDPFDGVHIDANALGWALAAVTSRAFRPGGPESPGTMLPLIDMCNHSFSPNAKVVAGSNEGEFSLIALRNINEHEQIVISYGNLESDILLLDYGFLIQSNPFDCVKIKFDIGMVEAAKFIGGISPLKERSDSPSVPGWQMQALIKLGLMDGNAEVRIVPFHKDHSPIDKRLLAAVRILCCENEEELNDYINNGILDTWDTLISPPQEITSCNTLIGVCMLALSHFSTSATEDAKELIKTSGDKKLSIHLRYMKKVILSNAVVALKKRIQHVQREQALPKDQ